MQGYAVDRGGEGPKQMHLSGILSLPGSIPGPHFTSPQFIIALLSLLFLSVLLLCLLALDTSRPGHMTGQSENDSESGMAAYSPAKHTGRCSGYYYLS